MAKGKWLKHGDVVFDNPLSDDFGLSYYEDPNGVVWHFKVVAGNITGGTGWNISARPAKPGDAYGVAAGRYPVAVWSATNLDDAGTQESLADTIDDYALSEGRYEGRAGGSPAGTLLLVLLALWLIGTDERRYINVRGEQLF